MSISAQPALENDDLLALAAIKKDGSFDAIKVQLLAVLKEDVSLDMKPKRYLLLRLKFRRTSGDIIALLAAGLAYLFLAHA